MLIGGRAGAVSRGVSMNAEVPLQVQVKLEESSR